MGTEKSQHFSVGDLVVISVAPRGLHTCIPGDPNVTDEKLIWVFIDEYLMGMVVEILGHPDFEFSKLTKILTISGIAYIWDGDIAEDDLSVVPLTEVIGEWLAENCVYDPHSGKYKLAKDLVAVQSFSQVAKAPILKGKP